MWWWLVVCFGLVCCGGSSSAWQSQRSNWWEVTSPCSLQTGHHSLFWEEAQPSNVTAIVALINPCDSAAPHPPVRAVIEVSVLGRGTSALNSTSHQALRCGWEASALPCCTTGVSRQRTSPCPPSRCQRCPLPSQCWPFYPCAVLSEPDTPCLTVTREEKDMDVDARPPKLNGISHFSCMDVTLSRHEQESWANLDAEVGWRGASAWQTGLV